jgi:hypothetical protein
LRQLASFCSAAQHACKNHNIRYQGGAPLRCRSCSKAMKPSLAAILNPVSFCALNFLQPAPPFHRAVLVEGALRRASPPARPCGASTPPQPCGLLHPISCVYGTRGFSCTLNLTTTPSPCSTR